MAKIKLHITDARMLELIDILKSSGRIRFRQEFCDAVGVLKQNIRNIKLGTPAGNQHFTVVHIANACKEYKVNANWIMGLETEIFRPQKESRKLSRTMRRTAK